MCSAEIRPQVEAFLQRELEAKTNAETASLAALTRGDLSSAMEIVRSFEGKRVLSRGLNADWGKPDPAQVIVLKTILSATPGILSDVEREAMPSLRIAAGMMELWGTNQARNWLPEGFDCGSHLGNDSAARMLLFAGYQQRDLTDWRESKVVKSVEVLASPDSCPACAKFSKKRYSLKNCPELPHPGCTHEFGCRCNLSPVL